MNLNKHIVVATLGLMAIGVIKRYSEPNVPLTPIFIGSYVFMLGLSVLDLFGGGASQLASALAMVALVSGIMTDVDIINQLQKLETSTQQTKGPGPTGPAGPPAGT